LDISSQDRGGVTVVAARGDVNAAGCARLERELVSRIDAGQKRLVLDLGEVRYVSSAGLRVFLIATKRMGADGAFVLARPTPAVRGVLELAGFLSVVKVAPDVDAAVAAAVPRARA
jgi:anti-anti-sigma factor